MADSLFVLVSVLRFTKEESLKYADRVRSGRYHSVYRCETKQILRTTIKK